MRAARLWLAIVAAGLVAGVHGQPAEGPMPRPPGQMPPGGMMPPDGHDHEAGPLPLASVKGHFELVPPLLEGLTSADANVRGRSAYCLGEVGKRSAIDALKPLLEDESRDVRMQAGVALCRLGDAGGLGAASAALTSGAEWLRYYAVAGLEGLEAPRAKELLQAGKANQSEFIATRIDEALAAWPWPSVEPEAATDRLVSFETLSDVHGAVADALIVESDIYWHKGEYLQCVRCNSGGTFLDPTWVEGYSISAWLLWSVGDSKRALTELRAGLDANPKNWEAWFNMGQQLSLMGEDARAIRFLEEAVALGAPAIQSRQYCHALEKAGHPDLAIKAWEALLEKHPDDPIAPRQIKRIKEGEEQA